MEDKIAQREALQGELKRTVDAGCRGAAANCRVIETFADHAHCGHDHGGLPAHFAR